MEEKGKICAKIDVEVERPAKLDSGVCIKSKWDWECYRNGKLLWKETIENIVTNQGLNRLLDTMFYAGSTTQITTWYVCLFEDNYTPLSTNTYAVPGYDECDSADYSGTRKTWTPNAAASSQQMSNSNSKAEFTMTGTLTVYGGALVGATAGTPQTQGDTAATNGTLYCSSKFSTSKAVVNGDVLKVTITLTAQDV